MRGATLLALLVLAVASAHAAYVVPPATLAAAPYAKWAHSHWVWLSSDRSNQANCTNFVKEFLAHNISVGALDVDSAWSTGFNNFVVDTTKFPDMQAFVNDIHSLGARVILWATSMVDTDSSNYAYGLNHTYYVRNAAKKDSTLKWWHGNGELLDYTNPEAVVWWHKQLDQVLDLGIDGWKTDGTDPFIVEYLIPQAYSGPISYRQYADMYYGDFFNYTRSRNGMDTLIMSRPVDSYQVLNEALGAYLEFSPKYVMYSGWVGDQDPTFSGLVDALLNMVHSAWAGYANFGSDIGGYRSGERTVQLFTRWFQLGAFCPLMENGGNNEHRPWMYDTPGSTTIVDLYRKFVVAHDELQSYLLTTGTEAMENGTSSITPQYPKPASLPVVQANDIHNFAFMLGSQLLVNPITVENATSVVVDLPAGNSWYDYFTPNNTWQGGQNITVQTPLEYFPVFAKTGTLLPLEVSTDLMGHGDTSSAGGLTFLVHTPVSGSVVSQPVREFQASGLVASYEYDAASATLQFTVTAHSTNIELLVFNLQPTGVAPVSVSVHSHAGVSELPSANRCSSTAPCWHALTPAVSVNNVHEMLFRLGAVPSGAKVSISNVRIATAL